jgi:hypothetical protein
MFESHLPRRLVTKIRTVLSARQDNTRQPRTRSARLLERLAQTTALIEPSTLLAVELERIRAGAADEESRSCLKRRYAMTCSHEHAMCSGLPGEDSGSRARRAVTLHGNTEPMTMVERSARREAPGGLARSRLRQRRRRGNGTEAS